VLFLFFLAFALSQSNAAQPLAKIPSGLKFASRDDSSDMPPKQAERVQLHFARRSGQTQRGCLRMRAASPLEPCSPMNVVNPMWTRGKTRESGRGHLRGHEDAYEAITAEFRAEYTRRKARSGGSGLTRKRAKGIVLRRNTRRAIFRSLMLTLPLSSWPQSLGIRCCEGGGGICQNEHRLFQGQRMQADVALLRRTVDSAGMAIVHKLLRRGSAS